MKALVIETRKDCYSCKDASEDTMTVRELINFLERLDYDTKVVLSFDGGYTYGSLNANRMWTT